MHSCRDEPELPIATAVLVRGEGGEHATIVMKSSFHKTDTYSLTHLGSKMMRMKWGFMSSDVRLTY